MECREWPQSRADGPAMPPAAARLDAGAILAAVGGVAYEWTIADDSIRWDDSAAEVFGLPSIESIATGRAFAGLLDPAKPGSRHDAVLNSAGRRQRRRGSLRGPV